MNYFNWISAVKTENILFKQAAKIFPSKEFFPLRISQSLLYQTKQVYELLPIIISVVSLRKS